MSYRFDHFIFFLIRLISLRDNCSKVIAATRRADKSRRPITIVVNQGFSNNTVKLKIL